MPVSGKSAQSIGESVVCTEQINPITFGAGVKSFDRVDIGRLSFNNERMNFKLKLSLKRSLLMYCEHFSCVKTCYFVK